MSAIPEPSSERPPSNQSRSLRSSVVEILAATANGCLTELGYSPGMSQRLLQLERHNIKLSQENQNLSRALHELKDKSGSENATRDWKNQVTELRQEIGRVKKQYDTLLAGQPSAYQQLLAEHRHLQGYHSSALQEINYLRSRISLLGMNSTVQPHVPGSTVSQTIPTPPATHGRPSPLATHSPQPQIPVIHPQNILSSSREMQHHTTTPVTPSFNQQGVYAVGNYASAQNQPASSSLPARSMPMYTVGQPNILRMDASQPAHLHRVPRTVNIPPLVPQLPLSATHPPRLSVDTRMAPGTEQQMPMSAHARLQSHAPSLSSPLAHVNHPQQFPTKVTQVRNRHSSATALGSVTGGPSEVHPPKHRAASLPRIETIEGALDSKDPPVPHTNVVDAALSVKRASLDSSFVTSPLDPRIGISDRNPLTQPPSPRLIRGSLKRSHSPCKVANDPDEQVDKKKQRLGDQGNRDVLGELQDVHHSTPKGIKEDNDGSEDEKVEVGPDGLRLIDDCLALVIENDADNEEIKTCTLCIARFKMGHSKEEPKPFVRPTTNELVQHCSSEHYKAWEMLRNHDV